MKKGQEKEHTKIKILQFLFAVPSIMVNIIRNGIYMVRNTHTFLFSLGFEKKNYIYIYIYSKNMGETKAMKMRSHELGVLD